MNGIEETQPLLRKIEVVGMSQLLSFETAFYQVPLNTLSHGVLMLVRATSKDVNTNLNTSGLDFLDVSFIIRVSPYRQMLNTMLITNCH